MPTIVPKILVQGEIMVSVFHRKLSCNFLHILLTVSISLLFGLAWFLLLYGRYSLYFTNVNWIYNAGGDVFQHQIGWEWFRQEPWHFPLGRIDSYGYPFGTSVSYMDAIPLMAIPFKLLSPLFKQHFQYLGLWELLSVIGQMLTGMLIIGEFTRSYANKILGASLLVLAPIMLWRAFGHNSLTAQWILLAGILFIILEYRHRLWHWAWVILFAVSMLIHLYFTPMLIPLWAISLFFRYTREKKKWMLAIDILAVVSIVLLVGYCFGLFSLKANDLSIGGFGYYSWNLNGFLNPIGNSSILNSMPQGTSGQYEGFSYLGLGNLLLLPFALILFLQKDYSRHQLFFILPFILVSIAYILFALSDKAFVNTQSLWEIHLPDIVLQLCSFFRSSGRFIWPVFYFVVLFGIISVIRNIRIVTPLLILVLFLQFIDIQPLYSAKKINGFEDYYSNLQSEFWKIAAKNNQHIVLIPATNEGDFLTVYEPLALYARQNKMTLSWGYFSRANYEAMQNYTDQAWKSLRANQADNQTMYIFWGSGLEKLADGSLSSGVVICKVDDYKIVLSKNNKMTQTNFDLMSYCSNP